MKVKKGDLVVITAGKDKGKKGDVIRTLKNNDRIVVEKVNLCTKHVKAGQRTQGGRIQFEAPISLSNVKVVCPNCEKSTRVGYEIPQEGKKYRICKKCGSNIEKSFTKS